MYSTSRLQGVWHHIHGCLHQICQCKVQFDQYVTTNIGVLFPYMVSLYNAVATGCNQSFYKSQQGGNLQLQSSCNQLRFSPVASLSEKLQLDFKTLPPTASARNVSVSTCNRIHHPHQVSFFFFLFSLLSSVSAAHAHATCPHAIASTIRTLR